MTRFIGFSKFGPTGQRQSALGSKLILSKFFYFNKFSKEAIDVTTLAFFLAKTHQKDSKSKLELNVFFVEWPQAWKHTRPRGGVEG